MLNIRPAKVSEMAQLDLGPFTALSTGPEVLLVEPTSHEGTHSSPDTYIVFAVYHPDPPPSSFEPYDEVDLPDLSPILEDNSPEKKDRMLLSRYHLLEDFVPMVLVLDIKIGTSGEHEEHEALLLQSVESWAADRKIARVQVNVTGETNDRETTRKVDALKAVGYDTTIHGSSVLGLKFMQKRVDN